MDTPDHQATITKAIVLLDKEIDQQRELLEALVAARDVLQLHALPIDSSRRMTRIEVRDYLEVSNSSLERYIRGLVPKGKPVFPQPVGKIGHKTLWKRSDVMGWKNAYERYPKDGQ